jgi:hypothetical protein
MNYLILRNKRKLIKLAKYFLYFNKNKVYGRVACLGRDVFDINYLAGDKPVLLNQQKVRVDLYLDWLAGMPRPRAEIVKQYLLRHDIYPLIEQQTTSQWDAGSDVLYFAMDSFSELTDQKFTHKQEGWSFCAHYSDIDHKSDFGNYFDCHGLLSISEIEMVYSLFFDWLEKKFPNKIVYFFHFPTKLDDREIYKVRGAEIHRVMLKLEGSKPYIKNVYIDEKFVLKNEKDSFPYHFSKKTNDSFFEQWCRINSHDSF